MEIKEQNSAEREGPPFFKNWSSAYLVIVVYLAALIALLYAFSNYFRY